MPATWAGAVSSWGAAADGGVATAFACRAGSSGAANDAGPVHASKQVQVSSALRERRRRRMAWAHARRARHVTLGKARERRIGRTLLLRDPRATPVRDKASPLSTCEMRRSKVNDSLHGTVVHVRHRTSGCPVDDRSSERTSTHEPRRAAVGSPDRAGRLIADSFCPLPARARARPWGRRRSRPTHARTKNGPRRRGMSAPSVSLDKACRTRLSRGDTKRRALGRCITT